ncbi:MAG: hypothetical protein ACI9QC_000232 [Oceanicoccus sp.]|jgi:hypothetical protein
MAHKKTQQNNSSKRSKEPEDSVPMVSVDLLDKLIRKILKEVIQESTQENKPKIVNSGGGMTEENMAKADKKIKKALKGKGDSDDDDDDDNDNDDSSKPKYENINSLLRYVESPDGGGTSAGGVKLVIMNFND